MSKQKNLQTINNSLNNVLVPEKPLSTVRPKLIMKNLFTSNFHLDIFILYCVQGINMN